jgi:formyl-CoA transferase
VNPGVISCEISGFGEGAGASLPGYDPLVQALSGLMSVTGPPGAPSKTGVAVTDVTAALYATIAVLAALYARRETGRGQRVTIDLLHASLALLANQSTGFLASGEAPVALGNVHPSIEPFATYRAADGELMICAGTDAQFGRLIETLGLAEDERFAPTSCGSNWRAASAARGCAGTARVEWAIRPPRPASRPGRRLIYRRSHMSGVGRVDETDGAHGCVPGALETPATIRRRFEPTSTGGDQAR